MELDQVEQSARRDQSRHVVRPSSQIAEPAEDAVRGEHHVERALEAICRVVDVAFDELGLDPKLFGEGASGFDRLRREIDPYDGSGPFLHPRHRIHAGVALEMKQTLARNLRRKLSELYRVEGRPVGAQPRAEYFVASMERSDCVPVGAIDDMSLWAFGERGCVRLGSLAIGTPIFGPIGSLGPSATGFASHNR